MNIMYQSLKSIGKQQEILKNFQKFQCGGSLYLKENNKLIMWENGGDGGISCVVIDSD